MPTVTGKRMADAKTAGCYALGMPPGKVNLAANAMAKLRVTGKGPPYIKKGGRILYDLDDVDAWLDSDKRQSTSDI